MAMHARPSHKYGSVASSGRRLLALDDPRQTAFLATAAYVLLIYLGLNALFGWTLWPWLKVVVPVAFVVGMLFARLSSEGDLDA